MDGFVYLYNGLSAVQSAASQFNGVGVMFIVYGQFWAWGQWVRVLQGVAAL